LPFKDGCFDAVLCQLGLMFFSNPGHGLKEFRRVLRVGAYAAVCVISTAEQAPMWGHLADAVGRRFPEQRPMFQLSFSLADPALLERLFAEAGFLDVHVERQSHEDTIDSFEDYWAPIEEGIGSLPQVYLALSDVDRRAVREEVRTKLSPYMANGMLHMGVEMLIGKGRA